MNLVLTTGSVMYVEPNEMTALHVDLKSKTEVAIAVVLHGRLRVKNAIN